MLRNQPPAVVTARWPLASPPSAANTTARQPFIGAEVVEGDAAAVAVDEQHHGEADADLGGGDGDDEQGEHLAVDVRRCSMREGERLMLTELRMSSIDISTSTPLLRARTPYTPMQNRTAPSSRNWLTSIRPQSRLRQHDGADQRGEQDERQGPERQQVRRRRWSRSPARVVAGHGVARAACRPRRRR